MVVVVVVLGVEAGAPATFYSHVLNIYERHITVANFLDIHHHQWRYSPESGLGLPYGFRDRYFTMWVISPTISQTSIVLILIKSRNSIGKPDGKRAFARARCRWEDNTKTRLKEKLCGVDLCIS
jgi:uncharacterized membrane protein